MRLTDGKAEGIDVDALLEDNWSLLQVGDAGNMTEEALNATRLLVVAVGHDVVASKEGNLELIIALADKVQ